MSLFCRDGNPDMTSPVQTARTFRITGRVQGVGFRWAAQEEARVLGLSGWIRNDEDGSVSGFIQGDPEPVEAFQKWLNQGPRSAKVAKLEWTEAQPTGLRLFIVK